MTKKVDNNVNHQNTDKVNDEKQDKTFEYNSNDKNDTESKLSIFETEYSKARELFDYGKYPECAVSCKILLKKLVISIIDENHRRLDLANENSYSQKIKSLGEKRKVTTNDKIPLEELQLHVICKLLDDQSVKYFNIAKGNYEKYSCLLSSYNYNQIAYLIEYCEDKNNKDKPEVKLGTQQILSSITSLLLARLPNMIVEEYHLLANFQHMKAEIERITDTQGRLNKIESNLNYIYTPDERKDMEKIDKREFEWIQYRGLLINKNDESRNIAFKVETFDNILSNIYEGVENNIKKISASHKLNLQVEEIRKIPKSIILDSGYKSGLNFGWVMHEIIQRKNEDFTLKKKIEEWCKFDSDVGFGKLDLVENENSKIDYGSTKKLSFTIKLSDNFIVYKRDENHTNLCSFIAGYIRGVLEKVTQQPLEITHAPHNCEQFQPGQNYCLFELNTDEVKIKQIQDRIKKQYSDTL